MVVSSGRGGDGLRGDLPHQSIHKETEDNHRVEGGLPACVCTVHRGRENAGEDSDGAI